MLSAYVEQTSFCISRIHLICRIIIKHVQMIDRPTLLEISDMTRTLLEQA